MDRILAISTVDELDRFHAEFGVFCPLEEREMKLARFGGAEQVEGDAPDWGRVAAEYDGILISPHMPERAAEHPCSRWYQYWDAACCAVWDTGVLTVVRGSSKELGVVDDAAAAGS